MSFDRLDPDGETFDGKENPCMALDMMMIR